MDAVEGETHLGDLLLGQFAFRDLPYEIGQQRHGFHIFVRIIHRFVADPQDRLDFFAPHDRHHQFADQIGMAFGHALSMGQGPIVVVDHRPALMEAIRPDARIGDRV